MVPVLEGKMTRKNPVKHKSVTWIPIPKYILEKNMKMNLFMEIYYVNKIIILVTKSKDINFLTKKE